MKMLKRNYNYTDNVLELSDLINSMIVEFNKTGQITNYAERRRQVNMMVVQTIVGCNIVGDNLDNVKLKLGPRPDNEVVAETIEMLRSLNHIENQFISADDMPIPTSSIYGNMEKSKGKIKEIKKILTGGTGVYNINITTNHILDLIKLGELLRKKILKRNAIIIGSILVVVTAAGISMYMIRNSKKDAETVNDDIIDIDDIDDDNEVNLGDDDVNLGDGSVEL